MGYVAWPVSNAPSLTGLGMGPRLVMRRAPKARRGVFARPMLPMAGLGAPYCYILPNGSRQCGDTTDAAFMAAAAAAGATTPTSPIYSQPPPTPPGGTNPVAFAYPVSAIPPGSVVGVNDQPSGTFAANALYLVNSNGTRSWIPDVPTLTALGFSVGTDIIRISTAELQSIPLGPTLSSASATAAAALAPAASVATSSALSTAPAAAGTVVSYLEPGAVYNASTGYYTNPDGTLYSATATSSTTAIDWTSPSTWPTWVWMALAAGVGVLALMKRR